MKNSPIASGRYPAARPVLRGGLAVMVAALIASTLPMAVSRAQPATPEDDETEVLTRGPVHEAFAGVVSYNPEPGVMVKTAPPEPIEEIPPEEKPEGDDVAWIPGYWAWDDERDDYLWISGTWRALPPGREWVAGYWREAGKGHQWISGYWADAEMRETTYLPPPPESLEVGPNIDPPSLDYGWTPGCWEWRQSRYVWRAGYWTPGRADWVWVPSYYVWTPRGFIFVPGYWDYVVERRGLLFAPVYYRSHSHIRRGYHYSPRIVISLSIFDDCLFLRPTYHHYYFGDYYDSRYDRSGFYMSFSFQSSRVGYDPFYSHRRWEHRADRDWERRHRAAYRNRRENEAERPPRIWSAQVTTTTTRTVVAGQSRTVLAEPIEQLATRKDNPVRLQRVAEDERQRFRQRGREVQQSREERRAVEAKPAAVTAARSGGETVEPAKVTAPRSSIVGKPAGQKGRNQVPPEQPQAPKVDPSRRPKAETPGRRPNADQRNAPGDTRQPEREKRDQPERRPDTPRDRNVKPAPGPRERDDATKAREEPERKAREAGNREAEAAEKYEGAVRAQEQADERARAAAARGQEELRRKEQQVREKAQPDEPRRNPAVEDATRAQRQAEERANANAARAREEPRQVQPAPGKGQPEAKRARDADAAGKTEQTPKAKAPAEEEEKKEKEKPRER